MNSRLCTDEMYKEAKFLVSDIAFPFYRKPLSIDLPNEFKCPICEFPFSDPVILHETGETFDRKCIDTWLKIGFQVCPVSKNRIWFEGVLSTNLLVDNLVWKWLKEQGLQSPTLVRNIISDATADERFQFLDLKKQIFSSTMSDQRVGILELKDSIKNVPACVELLGENPITVFELLILLLKFSNRFDENLEAAVLDILMTSTAASDRLQLILAEDSFTDASLNLCQRRNAKYVSEILSSISEESGKSVFYGEESEERFIELLRAAVFKFVEYYNAYITKAYEIEYDSSSKCLKELTFCIIIDSLLKGLEELNSVWGLMDSMDEDKLKVLTVENFLEMVVEKTVHDRPVEIANYLLGRISCLDALVGAMESAS